MLNIFLSKHVLVKDILILGMDLGVFSDVSDNLNLMYDELFQVSLKFCLVCQGYLTDVFRDGLSQK